MKKLTGRELDVMRILWAENESLTAKEILSKFNDDKISIFTIQNALKSLHRNSFIEIASIQVINKANTRKYAPLIFADDYAVDQFKNLFPKNKKKSSIYEMTFALVKSEGKNSEEDALNEIERMIQDYRQEKE